MSLKSFCSHHTCLFCPWHALPLMSGLCFALIKSHPWVSLCAPSHILKNCTFIVIFDHSTTNSYSYPLFCLCNQNKNWEITKSRIFLIVTRHVLEKPWFAGDPALYHHILYLLFEFGTLFVMFLRTAIPSTLCSFIFYYVEQFPNILYWFNRKTKYQNSTFWPLASQLQNCFGKLLSIFGVKKASPSL